MKGIIKLIRPPKKPNKNKMIAATNSNKAIFMIIIFLNFLYRVNDVYSLIVSS